MSYSKEAESNFKSLSTNPYPGRGIVLGTSPCGRFDVQVYWIMGRSENSRNRIFVLDQDTGFMKTQAFDESKLVDPSLIIYYPAKHGNDFHLITNGDQTDTVFDFLQKGKTFEDALNTRCYEPDGPNFTPRISGITYKNSNPIVYKLSILKSRSNNEDAGCERQFFSYEKKMPGLGHFIFLLITDGNPIPSFSGEPQLIPIGATAQETLDMYWNALNETNRVSLMVKWIDSDSFKSETWIRNKMSK